LIRFVTANELLFDGIKIEATAYAVGDMTLQNAYGLIVQVLQGTQLGSQ